MKYGVEIEELLSMKKYPQELHFEGDSSLLKRQKVSIVGTRKPSSYTRNAISQLAAELSRRGVIVVSGAAMGVDALAHKAAKVQNTIAVLPCGIKQRYPKINAQLIDDISEDGLTLSQFEEDFRATPYSFVVRNELVVALGEVLIVAEADLGSGSMRSVEFALAMNKPIYVLPHRLGESEGTNLLLSEGKAETILDINSFCDKFVKLEPKPLSSFLEFCKKRPSYDEVIAKYSNEFFEAELEGSVKVEAGVVSLSF